jgi:hypothetical protein
MTLILPPLVGAASSPRCELRILPGPWHQFHYQHYYGDICPCSQSRGQLPRSTFL